MTLQSLSEWLRCPNCFRPLEPTDSLTLGCVHGHRFDVNKRGFVSLLGPRSTVVGDTAAMLDQRTAVLSTGAYLPIAEAVGRAVRTPSRVIDAGCGTGYYLRAALQDNAGARALAMDLSPAAVTRAIRNDDRIDGLVADTWSPLPIAGGVADAVINVFAPRNLDEFSRVLVSKGSLVVVVPDASHLGSLRAARGMLDVPDDKADELISRAAPLFRLESREALRYELPLTPDLAAAISAMGPSAHHEPSRAPAIMPTSTVVAVDIVRLTRR
jgi:23S rRNA (guanine745-N1)-methyltransferase